MCTITGWGRAADVSSEWETEEKPAKGRPWPFQGWPQMQARLVCENLSPAGWKPLVEMNCCLFHYYLESLLFRYFPCRSGYLVFSSLRILNPRQEHETQEDIPNTRIKAQPDVWKMSQTSGSCQTLSLLWKDGKKASQTIIFCTLNFSWSQEQKKTAEGNQDYNRDTLSKEVTSTYNDFNEINKSDDLLQFHKFAWNI